VRVVADVVGISLRDQLATVEAEFLAPAHHLLVTQALVGVGVEQELRYRVCVDHRLDPFGKTTGRDRA